MSHEFPADLQAAPMFYRQAYAVAYNRALVQGAVDPDVAGRQALMHVDQRVGLKWPKIGAWTPRSAESVYARVVRLARSIVEGGA